MAGFSDYLEDKVLDHVFGGTAYTAPTTHYVALYTVAPTDTGGGTEVSGGAYARQTSTFTVSGTSPTTATNAAAVEYPTASRLRNCSCSRYFRCINQWQFTCLCKLRYI